MSFKYPEQENKALCNISFRISQGEFLIICGPSGCGKSTLLRHLKTCFTPYGISTGNILFCAKPLGDISERIQAQEIGFVMQSPENQVVTDKVWAGVETKLSCPITVRDGSDFLNARKLEKEIMPLASEQEHQYCEEITLDCKEIWFRYEKDLPDVVKGFLLTLHKGEFYAILGGNGAGKTTALKVISGLKSAYRGVVHINGKVGLLPQNPQTLFVKRTVREDLYEALYDIKISKKEKDEPTKGFDAEFKDTFAGIINKLLRRGVTVFMVSHDVTFCAEYAHQVGMFFDGNIVAEGTPREFFSGNSFYTTPANRMARHLIPKAVTVEDIIICCGGERKKKEEILEEVSPLPKPQPRSVKFKPKPLKMWRKILALLSGLVAILVLLECMMPFLLVFEGRKPKARELVTIAVLCAIGIAGRSLFFMLPQFKPVLALTIIAGVAFGGETGFLVGAVTMLVSNILFSQGPWTPWQMFAMGIIGFIAGVLFKKGWLRRNRVSLAVFGAFTAVIIYGGIMNPAAAFMVSAESVSAKVLLAYYITGLPMDLVHAFGTVLFIMIAAEPMLEKMDRIKVKYGLVE